MGFRLNKKAISAAVFCGQTERNPTDYPLNGCRKRQTYVKTEDYIVGYVVKKEVRGAFRVTTNGLPLHGKRVSVTMQWFVIQ